MWHKNKSGCHDVTALHICSKCYKQKRDAKHCVSTRCGTDGNRTSDTRIFSPLLYQLSYGTSRFVAAKIRHFSQLTRKKLQKLRNFCFLKCFALVFNNITKNAHNYNNKNLLNELKNRIFARPYPPPFPLLRGQGGLKMG